MRSKGALLLLSILISGAAIASDEAASTSSQAEQVIGFGDIKRNTKGFLELKDGILSFTSDKHNFGVSADSIENVVTRNDTQRAIRGTAGTLSQLTPYGAGRALSLLREQIDTLTIEYRDLNGALHGAIFTMPVGNAEPFKKELLANRAQTTVPLKQDSTESNRISEAKESQQ